jgi:hypothetical protein
MKTAKEILQRVKVLKQDKRQIQKRFKKSPIEKHDVEKWLRIDDEIETLLWSIL